MIGGVCRPPPTQCGRPHCPTPTYIRGLGLASQGGKSCRSISYGWLESGFSGHGWGCGAKVVGALTNIRSKGAPTPPSLWGGRGSGEWQRTGHLFGPHLIRSRNPHFLHGPFLVGDMGNAPFHKFFVPWAFF